MIKRMVIIAVVLCTLRPAVIESTMSQGIAGEGNEEADVIIVGEVYDTGAALLMNVPPARPGVPPLSRFVVIKVIDVIRGDERIKTNTLMQLLPRAGLEKARDTAAGSAEGMAPIRAERGTLVVVYADAVSAAPGFYSYITAFPLLTSFRVTGPW
ncbi:MAG: hypothetical protein ACMUIL_03820 [bacterium]